MEKKKRQEERKKRGEPLVSDYFRPHYSAVRSVRVIRSKSFNPIAAAFHLIAFSMLLAEVITLTPPLNKERLVM